MIIIIIMMIFNIFHLSFVSMVYLDWNELQRAFVPVHLMLIIIIIVQLCSDKGALGQMDWNLHNFQFSRLKAQPFSLVVFSFDVARDIISIRLLSSHKSCDHSNFLLLINFPAT
jgi:hypothetical protein